MGEIKFRLLTKAEAAVYGLNGGNLYLQWTNGLADPVNLIERAENFLWEQKHIRAKVDILPIRRNAVLLRAQELPIM